MNTGVLKHSFLCILFGSLLFAGEPFFMSSISGLEKEVILITSDDIEQLSIEFKAQAGRLPNKEEEQALIQKHYHNEILFQEALRLKLYQFDPVIKERLSLNIKFLEQGDTENMSANDLIQSSLDSGMLQKDIVVRRRMIERMEKVISSRFVVNPSDEVLKDYLQSNINKYQLAKRVMLMHVFVRNSQSNEDNINRIFEQWKEGSLNDEFIRSISPEKYVENHSPLSEKSLIKLFGETPGKDIHSQDVIGEKILHKSALGYHLVKILGFEAGYMANFTLIKDKVLQDYLTETQKQAVSHSLVKLRKKYTLKQPMSQVI